MSVPAPAGESDEAVIASATQGDADPRQEGGPIGRGIVYMCLAVSIFPFLNAAAKYLGNHYPVSEVVWARYLGHLVYMIIVFAPRRRLRLFATRQFRMQILRSLLLFSSTVFYFIALVKVPLATAASVTFVAPMIVTALSVPILGEKVGPRRWAAVIAGFLGTLMIVRPGGSLSAYGAAFLLLNALCYALYQVLSRRMARLDPADISITYVALVGVVLSSIVAPFQWRMPADAFDTMVFLSLGLSGGFAHYFIVKSVEHAPVSVLAPFNYGQLVGATVLGFFLFGTFPDLWTWAGAAVIIASGLYIAYRESRVGRQKNPSVT